MGGGGVGQERVQNERRSEDADWEGGDPSGRQDIQVIWKDTVMVGSPNMEKQSWKKKKQNREDNKMSCNWTGTGLASKQMQEVFLFTLMVFLQVICYNGRQFQGETLRPYTVKDCQSVQQSVLAQTQPSPSLFGNWTPCARHWPRELMVRETAISPEMSLSWKRWWPLIWLRSARHVLDLALLTIVNHPAIKLPLPPNSTPHSTNERPCLQSLVYLSAHFNCPLGFWLHHIT